MKIATCVTPDLGHLSVGLRPRTRKKNGLDYGAPLQRPGLENPAPFVISLTHTFISQFYSGGVFGQFSSAGLAKHPS